MVFVDLYSKASSLFETPLDMYVSRAKCEEISKASKWYLVAILIKLTLIQRAGHAFLCPLS